MAGEFGRQRWSGAVREAFLRGLAAHGSVRRACRETGMSVAGAYGVRKRDPDFARLWARAVARSGEARAARLADAGRKAERRDGMFGNYRKRRDGWTEVRVRIFLRALSETGCVRDACARARISSNSAYRMRQRDAKFAEAWARALDRALPTLEQAAWERAVMGWDEVVWKDGVEVSRKRRFSDALLRFLINHAGAGQPHRKLSEKELIAQARAAAYAAGGYFELRATSEETDAAIMRKLDAIDRARAREAADAAEKAAAEAAARGDGFGEDDDEDWDADDVGEDGGEDTRAEWVPKTFGQPRITGM
ncbi:molybdenum-dependent DNA-binding transcriptional regulator ModE [Sphingomonas kyeonggiensis]|uniref:Molybdenum-dependent DNA-binding transcriptional regulator ModE n=1 Tax=Sphingomonas kyeonggiensis TaxID=1268553 RepID=A0A7W7K463_9SPHN|nr:hypothetical protein [Sphingomonas kyeonggiensis]MBB4840719.1 molybdenum-dependent DNA-binding transcriptional regulator ModE [Sphingomonas kyeonggiensis]